MLYNSTAPSAQAFPSAPGDAAGLPPSGWRPIAAALALALSYYAGSKLGLALTFMPFPLSVLWPPNALVLAALLLAPVRWWWLLVLAVLPAHLWAQLEANIPLPMVLGWFASNMSEALIGALVVRALSSERMDLRTVRSVLLLQSAVVAAALLSSFFDAGLVRLIGWGHADFWTLWGSRLATNIVASLTFIPLIVTFVRAPPSWLFEGNRRRIAEAALLLAGLLAVGSVVFGADLELGNSPGLLYLPMPFLIWAALRFGPFLTSLSFAIVAFLVIWGAGHGHGPFLQAITAAGAALPIQLFLITIAVPLLLLAALMEERRRAEHRLRASQEMFSTVFRSGPDAIAVCRRRDGMIREANQRWTAMFGHAVEALPSAAARTAPADEGDRVSIATLIRESRDVRALGMTLHDRHGSSREVLVSVTGIELQGEAYAVAVVHDITELRRAEGQAEEQRQQITHLNRVASLTDFSSTLAHELSQPLTAILSNAQAALRFLARDPPNLTQLRSILTEIADADKRAGLLIYHLRLLMKRGNEEFAVVDLNQLARDALGFAHGTFVSSGIELSLHLSPELPKVIGDPVQLQQLMLNLISNACDAMQHQDAGSKHLRVVSSLSRHGNVRLTVIDTGCGIVPDQIERLFESFFTTKENGLGLGLPICRKIAHAHGGTLVAESRLGDGASFRLELPPAEI